MIIIELEPDRSSGAPDTVFTVKRDGEWLGDIEQLSDGTWVGDITLGNGPPSRPYATRREAIEYVVDPSGVHLP